MGILDSLLGFGFSYTNRKGKKFWLHMKRAKNGVIIYYFSKNPVGSIPKPPGYVVVENKRSGLPVLKKVV